MVANDGDTEGLYRAAIMQSGTPVPVGDVTKAQVHYNNLVENTDCSGESDTLACLRALDYEILKSAVDQTPSITGYNVRRFQLAIEERLTNDLTRRSYCPGYRAQMVPSLRRMGSDSSNRARLQRFPTSLVTATTKEHCFL